MNWKILLVDDELDILEFLSYNLIKEDFEVFTACNGREGIEIAVKEKPHLIVLDVMMPEMDGIETCTELRKNPIFNKTIILFLTARSEGYSQIAGFDAGADDYITKPVKPNVLVSRIKARLRRFNPATEVSEDDNIIQMKGFTIDKDRYSVIKDDKEISLAKKEFLLLLLLTSKPNKVFSRDKIYNQVWGSDVIVGDRTIDVHVRKIREKLSLDNIKTIKGVGYMFEE